MKLVIGNKNYSSWSLRPWLLLRQAGLPFEEELISFNAPDFKARVLRYSPSGKVPVLIDGDLAVWDSLAIAEYVAERFPEKRLWPEAREARARARSISAEMHSGFQDLRSRMTMNCSLRVTNVLFDKKVRREQARLVEIWREARERFGAGGPFLFGHFTVADAFFAPVTIRFTAYGVQLPPVAQQYVETIQALPAMQEWMAAGRAERDYVDHDEPYREREEF
jgi:glutathione S-transferase